MGAMGWINKKLDAVRKKINKDHGITSGRITKTIRKTIRKKH